MAGVYETLVQPSSLVDATKCVQGIDNLKLAPLSKTRRSDNVVDIDDVSSNCSTFMYMLVYLKDRTGSVLYRIDPVSYLETNDCSSHDLDELRPLVVFPSTCSRMDVDYFSCIKLGSKLYFFGLDHYFDSFGIHEDSTNVYTIEEDVLMGIKPSETNHVNNFKQLFTKTKNPMFGPKYVPTVFVANHKLYVMSKYYTKTLFEVFSPVDETWQVLPTPNDGPLGSGVSVVSEQNQTFYYIAADILCSFSLETHEWTMPPDFYDQYCYTNYDDDIYPRPPAILLDKCVTFIGDTAFGYVYDHDTKTYYVSASRTFSSGEELMKPNLAPDRDFLEVLRTSRFTYMSGHYKLYSDYIVALQDLDGKQVLCIVTYGAKLPDKKGDNVNTKTSYIALSFFDIPGNFYTSEERPVQECNVHAFADEKKAEDGGVVRRYFNAKFRHTAHFVINSSNLCTHGQLKACFF
ncbi:hypothetical protein POM88_015151 [Heracleum sosnowskyi]|uniref:Uncharacterized protein n=1 Tax=Heracleum sosnowskyi TaxID=360622 RepID=A0AAD8MX62_9APIA|nr:hypothetical protein POM88_015151 [Heracleum sosnowskyi]